MYSISMFSLHTYGTAHNSKYTIVSFLFSLFSLSLYCTLFPLPFHCVMTSQTSTAVNASNASSRQSTDTSRKREIASRRRRHFLRSKSASLSTSSELEAVTRDAEEAETGSGSVRSNFRKSAKIGETTEASDDVCLE